MSMTEEKKDLTGDWVEVTCTSSPNIAVIKYWGKRDTGLILPINSSISGTMDQGTMHSRTTITASKDFPEDQMFLNNKEVPIVKRIATVVRLIRQLAQDYVHDGQVVIKKEDWSQYKLRIVSANSFPTAAGLASSASGFACFTTCLASLFNVTETPETKGLLSTIARQGSGSACRSMYGGWVSWEMGSKADGSDSMAVQIADENHWDDMRVIILVANRAKKETSSTSGMQLTCQTSPLVAYRAEKVVPQRMKEMKDAILAKDFQKFGELTIMDSNQFHAVCLDTYPPIFYMNDTSKRVIHVTDKLNAVSKELQAAYTFDAGPNAVVYLPAKNLDKVLNMYLHYFLPKDKSPSDFVLDPLSLAPGAKPYVDKDVEEALGPRREGDGLVQIIVSKVGGGPKIVSKKSTFGTK